MPSKVKVPRSQRLAVISESEIKERLSYFSIPRKLDLDIGIDFSCELLEDDSPSSKYFFVQAKGTKHFGKYWRRNIKKTTITYWLQQPSPVFLVVYEENSGNCYWLSVEDNRKSLIEKMRTDSETIQIKIDRSHILEKGKNKNGEFIRKIEEDIASVNLIRGHPQFIGEGYVKRLPIVYLSKGAVVNIKGNIRTSMLYLINHYLLNKDIENAYLLCDFLTKFDKSHYDHFVLFGSINKFLGKREEAKKSFEEAIKICKRDKEWNMLKKPLDLSIEEIIALIEKEMESL
jgi:tetratricopeptide (TPR) repeat protein